MAAPIVYKSTDTSAPILTGTAGDLVALLDACLVNGYGSKAAAGWTKAFSGTNLASYRQGGNHQLYLDIDDSASGTGGAKEASAQGYEAMTAVGTGTNRFGTSSTNNPIRKSTTADSTARAWIVVADAQTVMVFILSGDTVGAYSSFAFGDFFSFVAADAWNVLILTRTGANTGLASGSFDLSLATSFTATNGGLRVARKVDQTTKNVAVGMLGIGSSIFTSPADGPNAADSKQYLSRLLLTDATVAGGLRGYLRGVYQMVNGGTGVADGDTFSGTGDFAGRTFLVVKQTIGGATLAIETTAWDTST